MDSLERLQSLDVGSWRRHLAVVPVTPAPVAAPRPQQDPGGDEPPEWAAPGVHRETRPEVPGVAVVLVQQAVRDLVAAPPSGRPADVAAVLGLAEQLRGLGLRELAELDASGQHVDAGHATAASWLRATQTIGDDSARAAVRLAARVRQELPALGRLLEDGGTTLEHVRAVAAGTQGLDPELVRDAQQALVDLVEVAEPARVRRELRERAEAVDSALARDAARRQQERQGFSAHAVGGAGVVLSGTLADEDGAVFLHGLDLAVESDRTAGDTRGLPARRAAVLVQWAREAAARVAGPGDTPAQDARTVRSHLLVTCTLTELRDLSRQHAEDQLWALPLVGAQARAVLTGDRPVRPPLLPTGARLLPEALRRLTCDATLTLVVEQDVRAAHPVRGQGEVATDPLSVGRSSRTVTGRQFTALVVRDRSCVVRGCHRRPAQCEAHHVRHWLDGGLTDLDNLVLLCHAHHHDHHDRGHDLEHRDGRWITASGWSRTRA